MIFCRSFRFGTRESVGAYADVPSGQPEGLKRDDRVNRTS